MVILVEGTTGAEGGKVAQSIAVSISETYDLSTSKNRMGLIAIRTPSMTAIQNRYPGFIRNFKFLRLKSCDVVLSCASSLPADPLQVGTTAGKVAPQDMFNPILYKAVSNDSWNGLLNRIYASSGSTNSLSHSVRFFRDAFSGATDSDVEDAYYGLLAEGSFKKAHVQSGLEMRNLVPLVYHILHSNGTMPDNTGSAVATSSQISNVNVTNAAGDGYSVSALGWTGGILKGRPVPMPPVECTTGVIHASDGTVTNTTFTPVIGSIVPCYVACIVTPPASLNITYFRMTVRWNVEFFGVASDMAKTLMPGAVVQGDWSYYRAQNSQQVMPASKISDLSESAVNADVDDLERSVEADGVDLDLVMEK